MVKTKPSRIKKHAVAVRNHTTLTCFERLSLRPRSGQRRECKPLKRRWPSHRSCVRTRRSLRDHCEVECNEASSSLRLPLTMLLRSECASRLNLKREISPAGLPLADVALDLEARTHRLDSLVIHCY